MHVEELELKLKIYRLIYLKIHVGQETIAKLFCDAGGALSLGE
jgi:hypothetical protein